MSPRHVPVGLALACVIPVLADPIRGTTILLEWDWGLVFSPRCVDRLPLFVHVVASSVFYGLGALQVLPGFRARHPIWHRRAGKSVLAAGLLGALSATWMSALHLDISGPILLYGRLVFGPLWGLLLIHGVAAILRRDLAGHGAWPSRRSSSAGDAPPG